MKLITDMKTNKYVNDTILKLVGKFEALLSTINRMIMSYYGLSCRHDKIDQLLIFREIKIKDRDGWRKFVIGASNMIPPTMHATRD